MRLLVVVAVLSLSQGQGSVAFAQSAEGREDLVAAAPSDVGVGGLGRLFTSAFMPVTGQNARLAVGADAIVVRQREATERRWGAVSSASELRANARVWGIGVGAATQSHRQHGVYRAIQLTSIHELDPSFAVRNVAPGAEWYVSAVYIGRLVEYHFSSASDSVSAAFSGPLPVGNSVSSFAQAQHLSFRARTVGFQATASDAMFAADAAGLAASYVPTGEPQPILVRYSRVPRSGRAVADATRPRRVGLVTVQFPNRKPNNTPWDFLGNAPDIQVTVSQNGRRLAQRQGRRDAHTVQLDFSIGELTVSPASPLVLEFVDLDPSQNDPAGTMQVDSLPMHETAQFNLPPNDFGVSVVLSVGP